MFEFAEPAISLAVLAVSMAALAYMSRYVIESVEDFIELSGLSETAVGFSLLSVITSTPELVVAFFAVLDGTPELSVGDLLGSNVFNIGVVVGVLMLTAGFLKECPEGLDEIAEVLLLSSIIPLVLVVLKAPLPLIGCGLLFLFVFSVYRETRTRTAPLSKLKISDNAGKRPSKLRTTGKILIGTLIVVLSARFTVSSALETASFLNVPPIFIGALVVALGTSLPELSLSLTAVKRGRTRLASANAIGSNLTNLSLILGIVFLSSIFFPFSVDILSFSEIISFVLITSLIIWYHMTKGVDCRLVGAILLITYVIFQITIAIG